MFEQTLSLLALGSLGLAALAVPVARSFVLGDIHRDWLCDELDFERIDNDGLSVHLKRGRTPCVFRIWVLTGVAYETRPEASQRELCSVREGLFHELSKQGCPVRLFGIKRQKELSFQAQWPSITLEEVARADAKNSKSSFALRWFLIQEATTVARLEETRAKVQAGLAAYDGKLLSTPEDKGQPCPLHSVLNYLVSGEFREDIPALCQSVTGNLPASDLHYDAQGNLTTFTPLEQHHRVIGIRLWPEILSGRLIAELGALKCDLEISQIVLPQTRFAAAQLQQKASQLSIPVLGDYQGAAEREALASELSSDKYSLNETQFALILRATSRAELDKNTERVARLLSDRGVNYAIETSKAAIATWFNRLPGNNRLVRPLRMISHNVAALWPFLYAPEGLMSSAYCANPVRLLKTASGQGYAFQFQISPKPQAAGNFLVFAGTGSGKTTLISYLLSGLAQTPDFRSFIFDSKEGARAMVEMLGGQYRSFDNLGFNPLDVPDDSLHSRQILMGTLRAMAGTNDEEIEEGLARVVDLALSVPHDIRTLNQIYQAGFAPGSTLGKLFEKWVLTPKGKAGQYHHVFNAPRDGLKGFIDQSFMTGINMNEALEDDILGPPVVYHITQAIADLARQSASPFGIFIDEAANLLRNAAFRERFVNVLYREVRKQNGFVGMAFQEPAALTALADANAIIGNTSTFLFFPNANNQDAERRKALSAFALNEEQLDFVSNRNPEAGARRCLIIKRDSATGFEESVIVDTDLTDLGNAFRFFRSGPEANAFVDHLKAKEGAQWLQKV